MTPPQSSAPTPPSPATLDAAATTASSVAAFARRAGPLTTTLAALAAVGALLAAALIGLRRVGDFDLPWHIATGEWMLRTRSLLPADPFSFTCPGCPWAQKDTICDLGLFLTHRFLGMPGLQLLAGLGVLAATLPVFLQARRYQPLLAPLCSALALLGAYAWFMPRPVLASLVLFPVSLLLIDGHRRAIRGEQRRHHLLWLPAVQLVWANCHGGAVLGLGVYALYAAHLTLCALTRRLHLRTPLLPAAEAGRDPLPYLVLVAMVLATGATAGGPAVLLVTLRGVGIHHRFITEWQPVTLKLLLEAFPAAAVLLLLLLLAAAGRRFRLGLFDLALCAGLAMLAARRVRVVPFFCLAAAPLLASWLRPRLDPPLDPPGARRGQAAWQTLGLLLWLAAPAYLLFFGHLRLGPGYDSANYPEAAVRFIEQQSVRGPLYNFLPFGGYLVHRLYPRQLVFIDGRTATLYPQDLVAEAFASDHDAATFAALDRRYRFQAALVRSAPGEVHSAHLAGNPDFALVFLDDTAALYVRSQGVNHQLASDAYRYRLLRHVDPLAQVLRLRAPRALAAARLDAERAVEQAPASVRAHAVLGSVCVPLGDRACVLAAAAHIRRLEPGSPLPGALEHAASRLAAAERPR